MITPGNTSSDQSSSNTVSAASRSKPMTRGILNTTKKKKFVYKGGGKRLSFGAGGKRLSFGGGGGLGPGGGAGKGKSLLGKKFVTPKRLDSTGPLTSTVRKDFKKRVGLSSALKNRSFRHSNPLVNTGNVKSSRPEYIIHRHPSPILPIWIGSFYNGDGLDGSVVGDLVMIMGEVVIEHCANCQKDIGEEDHPSENKGCDNSDENITESPADVDGISDSSNNNTTNERPNASLIATPNQKIKGVNNAANSIAACARRSSEESSVNPQSQTSANSAKNTTFCSYCTRFLRARFVKNANGTDMNLQREALRARRKYMMERKRQMECLVPTKNMANGELYSVGFGPPA
mmetsp:Transcript_21785/g.45999  ORF Transcript_21785/g.45999 Transcript_21785/m.45999 type:complete len:345 (+) Transcript_21785:205-1239(+)